LQPAWSDLNYGAGDFPQAEKAANEVLALPIYPELTLENMRVIAGAVQHAGVVRV
jgi:dTDP-4-amino-4,6-dideoxygalactose transaminase